MRPFLFLALLLPLPAHALESAPAVSPHATATLVSEADSVAPGQHPRLALRLVLAPGWHTYWQNPGDAGAAPTLSLEGASAGPFAFPVPQRIEDAGLVSYALTGDVLLPFTATPPAAGPLRLRANADYLVCATICVPEQARLSLDVPAGSGAAGADAPRFAAAEARMPRPSPFPATIGADGTLRLSAPGLEPQAAQFLPSQPGVIDQLAPQPLADTPEGPALGLKLLAHGGAPVSGVLVLTDRGGQTSALAITAEPAAAATSSPGWWQALLLAFAGGLVLNLMPCVLPVLAMKAMALARLSGAGRAEIRREAGLYVAGVLVAFGAIGAAVLGFAAAGHAVGWGVQFQSAAFTALVAWLMLLVGLNLAGVFEVVGGLAGAVGRARGSFLTGLLAVAVATPCTAPFMATALGAALLLPKLAGFAVFLALGCGLAFPYALLALVPGAARLLPRPGAWMLWLRRGLSLPMFVSAAFFLWVVFAETGKPGLVYALLGAAWVGSAAWRLGRLQRLGPEPGGPRPWAWAGLWAAGVLLSLGAIQASATRTLPQAMAGTEPFSSARLAALRAEHRPVLVDMSASWCITCLVNERVALSPSPVRAAFQRRHAVLLHGDWTQQDGAITRFLQAYGRTGVPLYVFFPAAGPPQVLPQILTESTILARLGA